MLINYALLWKLKAMVITNVPSNFYDVCAEEISCEQGNSHKCVASCRLSFIHADNDFCKHVYHIRVLIIIL
jgi:hypothetical protein